MISKKNNIKATIFYTFSIIYILLNLWFITQKETYLFCFFPFILLIFLLSIYSYDKLFSFIIFFTPLSLSLQKIISHLPFDLYIPTEILIIIILTSYFFKILTRQKPDKSILLHPVSIAIYFYLFWLFITSLTSTYPIVSFKFLISRIWFIGVMYFFAIKLFRHKKITTQSIWLYIISLLFVITYTIIRHQNYGLLNKQAAHFVVTPFFNDHTSYGAALAMFLPFTILFSFSKEYSKQTRILSLFISSILLFAFILSYSRAAWLSLILGGIIFIIILLRIKFRYIFILFISISIITLSFQSQIVTHLERNTEVSSSNLSEHFSSMTNITTDVSNLERINRWNCAIRMFKSNPFFGFGPGTYTFNYASYQQEKDKTIISTNYGDGGNAHSEYLGSLSESGVLGLLSFLSIIITVIYTAIHTYFRLKNRKGREIVLACLIGLCTYYIHSFLNNFLDTDKLSVPFWLFTAIIVFFNISLKEQEIV